MIKAGDVFVDNDKRMKGREIRVERVEGDYAYCVNVHARSEVVNVRVRLDRMHNVKKSSGFTRKGAT